MHSAEATCVGSNIVGLVPWKKKERVVSGACAAVMALVAELPLSNYNRCDYLSLGELDVPKGEENDQEFAKAINVGSFFL